jgi:putative membrane protein
MNKFNKILILVLVIFHVVGLLGMLFFDRRSFIELSWVNLLISTIIALISYKKKIVSFIIPFLLVVTVTFFAEVIGVKTAILFGHYKYGDVLGLKLLQVPLLIGFLWLTLSLGAKSIIKHFTNLPNQTVYVLSALLMVGIDYLIEPIAINFGYWEWQYVDVPIFNYACWFLLAYVNQLLLIKVKCTNNVLEALFVINALFFSILNYFL